MWKGLGRRMIEYMLNPYVLINVLWMVTAIIVAKIIRSKK